MLWHTADAAAGGLCHNFPDPLPKWQVHNFPNPLPRWQMQLLAGSANTEPAEEISARLGVPLTPAHIGRVHLAVA